MNETTLPPLLEGSLVRYSVRADDSKKIGVVIKKDRLRFTVYSFENQGCREVSQANCSLYKPENLAKCEMTTMGWWSGLTFYFKEVPRKSGVVRFSRVNKKGDVELNVLCDGVGMDPIGLNQISFTGHIKAST